MPIAITPESSWEYQLDDDHKVAPTRDKKGEIIKPGEPDPDGTWFTIRSLPDHIAAEVQNAVKFEMRDEEGKEDQVLVHSNVGTTQRMMLEYGVLGWRNWQDEQGKDVPLTKTKKGGADVAVMDYVERLLPKHRAELSRAIDRGKRLTVHEGN